MNHRSNMDYIIASYLAAERAALSYAVGEWARLWGLQQLIRAMGAYFVRRNSKDDLYRRVLERYIAMATEAGVTQAVYPEGGLTKRRPPARAALRRARLHAARLSHPRRARPGVRAARAQLRPRARRPHAAAGRRRAGARGPARGRALGNTLGFVANQLGLLLRSRWHRFGYACVNFGTPVSVRGWAAARGIDFDHLDREQRHAEVAALGRHLMDEVGRLIPVLPVPLVATVLLREPAARVQPARSEGGGQPARAHARSARRAPLRAAARLGLCSRCRPAHADAAAPGRRGRRPVR